MAKASKVISGNRELADLSRQAGRGISPLLVPVPPPSAAVLGFRNGRSLTSERAPQAAPNQNACECNNHVIS